jgi:hypothetical protein
LATAFPETLAFFESGPTVTETLTVSGPAEVGVNAPV